MADTYTTIQQHQPLRVPTGWSQEEKRLVAQLEEIFDDIYRRYGRLKMSDLGKSLQIEITEGEIKVGRINVTELLGQTAAIDAIKTMTVSSVEAGSTVTINKDEVTIATPEFSVQLPSEGGDGNVLVINKNEVSIATPEFSVRIPSGEDDGDALRIDGDGVTAQTMSVSGEFNCAGVAKRFAEGGTTFTVTSFSQIVPLLTDRVLDRDITINCNPATKVWPDVVTLKGVHGAGSITINGNGVQLSGLFTVESCDVKITINKLYANYKQDRSPYLTLNDCTTSTSVTATVSATYKASDAKTYRTAGTTFYGYGDYFYQGATGSYKNLYGYLWFSGASALSGKTLRKATLKLRRVAGIGGGTAAKITIYTSAKTTASGNGASELTKVGDIGSIYDGEEKTFDLPIAAVSALVAGGAIVFYTEETAPTVAGNTSGRYAKFYGVGDYTPELTVTYDATTSAPGNTHQVTDGGFGQYLVKAGLKVENPVKTAYGSGTVSGDQELVINYASAGFTAVPCVFINYSTTAANWSGDNGAIKVHSKTKTGAKAIVGGSFSTVRAVDWMAIGV